MTITAPNPASPDTKRVIPKIVSVDDHIIEPADVWTSRLPKKYLDVGPRLERLRVDNLKFDGMNYSFDIVGDNSPGGKFEKGELPLRELTSEMVTGLKSISGANTGNIADTQEMLDFCAEHNIVSNIELVDASDAAAVDAAYDRVVESDVRYRFVIDASTI